MEIIYMTFIIDGDVEYLTENSNLNDENFQKYKKKIPDLYLDQNKQKKLNFNSQSGQLEEQKINDNALDDQSLKSLKSIRGENDEMKYYAYSDSHKNIAYYKCWTKNCQGRAKGIIVENNKKLQIDGELKVLRKI
jgi:hypothetical protein